MDSGEKRKHQRGRKRWTEEEDAILHEEAMKQSASGNVRDWHRIATKLPGRTNKDCRKRWVNKVCGGLKKGLWDAEEDRRLKAAVEKHGQRWPLIANEVGFRSPDQCAKRWQYGLDPRLKHKEWTAEEDKLLLALVQEKGREWKIIQQDHYKTRSRIDLKNRYTILQRRLGNNGPDADFDDDDASDDSSIGDSEEGDTRQAERASSVEKSPSHRLRLSSVQDSTEADFYAALTGNQQQEQQQQYQHSNDWLTDTGNYQTMDIPSPGPLQDSTDSHVPMDFLDSSPIGGPWDDLTNMTFSSNGGSVSSFPHYLSTTAFNTGDSTPRGSTDSSAMQFDTDMFGSLSTSPLDAHALNSGTATVDRAKTMSLTEADLSKVVIAVNDCDKDTLDYLLSVTKPIKGKVKMEITM